VADPGAPPLPEPVFLPSEFEPLPQNQLPTPDYEIRRDLVRRRTVVSYRTQSGVGVNGSRYTVSLDRPAEAEIESDFEYPVERPGRSIRVRSRCITRSDAEAFHHETRVEITLNGEPYWDRTWSLSVPRQGA
jgi:hypothetical protein